MKRFFSWIFFFSLLAGLAVPLTIGTSVYAAEGEWIDFSRIEVAGIGEFQDTNPLDDTLRFEPTIRNGCSENNYIEFSGGDTILDTGVNITSPDYYASTDEGATCSLLRRENLTLSEEFRARLLFEWVDQNQLKGVASGTTYTRIEGTNLFQNTGGSCTSVIDTAGEVSGSQVSYTSCSNGVTYTNITISNTAAANTPGTEPLPPGTVVGDDGELSDEPESCESEGGSFSFLLCPLMSFADFAIRQLDEKILNALLVDDEYKSEQLRDSWARIRNIAYILLIPVMLMMVIGTALGFQFLDAYTVKRALPRMVASVIFIALSYDIAVIMIEVTNGVGRGITGLVAQPFGGLSALELDSIFEATAGNDLFFLAAAGGAAVAGFVGIGILASYLLVGALVLLIVFILLALRRVLIVALILLAPLAILTWIFPGNDKPWKFWWSTFSKLLYLFPLLMVLLVTGRIFAFIVRDVETGIFGTIIKLTAFIGPYFLIPTAFKFVGGAFGNLAGMVNDRGKGVFDRQRKYRGDKRQSTRQDLKNMNRFGNTPGLRKLNTPLGYLANQKEGGLAVRPSKRHSRVMTAINDSGFEHALEQSEKLPGAKGFFANDDYISAALQGGGNRAKTMEAFRAIGYDEEQASLGTERALRLIDDMGMHGFQIAAAAKAPGTGTYATEDDIAQWHLLVGQVAHGDKGLTGSLIATGKSGFRSAQRYEVSEASFGTHMKAVDDALKSGGDREKLKEVSLNIVSDAYEGGGPAAVIGARNAGVAKMFSKVINRNIESADNSYESARQSVLAAQQALETATTPEERQRAKIVLDTQTEIQNKSFNEKIRQRAAVKAIQEQLGSAKQVVSRVIADEVLNVSVPSIPISVPEVDSENRPVIDESGNVKMTVRYVDGNRVQELDALAQNPVTGKILQSYKKEYNDSMAEFRQRQAMDPQLGGQISGTEPGQTSPGNIGPS